MDWWENLGAYAQFFGSTPALAVDFATTGPNIDMHGADAADALQSSPLPMPVYDQGG